MSKIEKGSDAAPLTATHRINYKWIALSVTTIGALMSSIDSTIVVLDELQDMPFGS